MNGENMLFPYFLSLPYSSLRFHLEKFSYLTSEMQSETEHILSWQTMQLAHVRTHLYNTCMHQQTPIYTGPCACTQEGKVSK